jgi:hypothetical protein
VDGGSPERFLVIAEAGHLHASLEKLVPQLPSEIAGSAQDDVLSLIQMCVQSISIWQFFSIRRFEHVYEFAAKQI